MDFAELDSRLVARSRREAPATAPRCLSLNAMAVRLASSGVEERGSMPSAAAASPTSSDRFRWSLTDMLSDTSMRTDRRRFSVRVCVTVAVGSNRKATIKPNTTNRVAASAMRTHAGKPCRRQ